MVLLLLLLLVVAAGTDCRRLEIHFLDGTVWEWRGELTCDTSKVSALTSMSHFPPLCDRRTERGWFQKVPYYFSWFCGLFGEEKGGVAFCTAQPGSDSEWIWMEKKMLLVRLCTFPPFLSSSSSSFLACLLACSYVLWRHTCENSGLPLASLLSYSYLQN